MKLLLDMGNTRMKWGWYGEGQLQSANALTHDRKEMNDLLHQQFADEDMGQVVISNVLGEEVENQLKNWFSEQKGVQPRFLAVTSSAYGLKNAYTTPEQLGIDRWLAMIAAFRQANGAVCVVDCGTAATLDIVRQDGQHLGGLILPGLSTMRHSLSANTSGAQWREEDGQDKGCLGLDTTSCIALASVSAICGMVERTATKFEKVYQTELNVMITGGDAQVIAYHLQVKHSLQPELVLNGIAIASETEA